MYLTNEPTIKALLLIIMPFLFIKNPLVSVYFFFTSVIAGLPVPGTCTVKVISASSINRKEINKRKGTKDSSNS